MKKALMVAGVLLLLTACTHTPQSTSQQDAVLTTPDLSGIPYSYFIAIDTTSEKFHPTTVPQGALLAPCNGFIVRQQQSAQEASSQGDLIAAAVRSALTAEFDEATIYYNPLKEYALTLERVVVADEEVQIFLKGTIPSEQCEEDLNAMIVQKTVHANAPGRDVRVYLNGILWQ